MIKWVIDEQDLLPRKILKRGCELDFSKKLIILALLKTLKFVILICDDCSKINNNKITQSQGTREIYRGSALKSLFLSLLRLNLRFH